MATESPWRRRSREVIEATLAALPPDATLADKRRALRDAYPFGERRYTPYKIWCVEVRDALGTQRLTPQPEAVLIGPHGVRCDWCRPSPDGCLACSDARRKFAAMHMKDRTMLRRLLIAALEGDEADRLVLADWHEEYGLIGDARWVREMWDPIVARRMLEMEEQG